jgi:colicin import membrane protein
MNVALPLRRHPSVQHKTPTAFALAVLMHGALVGGMSLMVQWKTQPSAPIVAELWSAVPPVEVAPPPPPPPPPAPVPEVKPPPEPPKAPPEIVTQEVKKTPPPKEPPKVDPEIEKKKLEAEKKKIEAEKKKIELEKKRADEKAAAEKEALRQKELDRLIAQAGTTAAPAAPSAASRASNEYIARLQAYIRQYIVFNVPDGTSPQIHAEFEVELLPTGEQARVRLLKRSGLPGYDDAVERAIGRANPFPRKPDGTVDRVVTIRFYPVEKR